MVPRVYARMTCKDIDRSKNLMEKVLKDFPDVPLNYITGTHRRGITMETLFYLVAIAGSVGSVVSMVKYEMKATRNMPTKPIY